MLRTALSVALVGGLLALGACAPQEPAAGSASESATTEAASLTL